MIEEEIKREIENLYMLSKKLKTKNETITYINEPKSINNIIYIREVEKYENPQKYYHFQNGFKSAEIRKGRKGYNLFVMGYEPKKEEMEQGTIKKVKNWGNVIRYIYQSETLDEAIENYKTAIKNCLQWEMKLKENLLIW